MNVNNVVIKSRTI